jgi:hypothetical protein
MGAYKMYLDNNTRHNAKSDSCLLITLTKYRPYLLQFLSSSFSAASKSFAIARSSSAFSSYPLASNMAVSSSFNLIPLCLFVYRGRYSFKLSITSSQFVTLKILSQARNSMSIAVWSLANQKGK